jgi:hypothetical protein
MIHPRCRHDVISGRAYSTILTDWRRFLVGTMSPARRIAGCRPPPGGFGVAPGRPSAARPRPPSQSPGLHAIFGGIAEKRIKRPRDPLQLAKLIGDIATGQVEDRVEDGKDPAAVEFARRVG